MCRACGGDLVMCVYCVLWWGLGFPFVGLCCGFGCGGHLWCNMGVLLGSGREVG